MHYLENYNAFIFDFDLTLADTKAPILASFHHVLDLHGLPYPSDEVIISTIGDSLYNGLVTVTGEEDPETVHRYEEEYRKFGDVHMTEMTEIYPETIPMLKALKDAGKKVAIVSSKKRFRVQEGVDAYGLSPYIDLIIGGEDIERYKPDPQGIEMAIERLGVTKEEVLYIGDSEFDAGAAENAGVDYVGVTTGSTTKEALAAYPHIAILPNLTPLGE